MLKKMILSLLVLSMLVAAFAGCNFGKKEEGTTDSVADATDTTPRGSEDDSIGDYDFDGEEFTILTREETKYEFQSDKGLGGDTVDRAVYKRNYNVSNRFNVSLKVVSRVGGWDQRAEFLSAVRAEAMGGNGGYDLVSTHSVYLGWMAVEGLAYDMATLPEMDFAKAWWNQNLYDEVNINGHVYFMLGDICTTLYEYLQVVFFNEDMFEDYFDGSADVIYDLVQSGKWTWEDCMEYAKAVENSAENVTKYGMVMNIHSWRASFVSQDAYLYERDDNGDLYLPEAPSDKMISIVETMIDFYANDNIMYHSDWGPGNEVLTPLFTGGNVLFYPQMLGEASKLAQSMGGDAYGVIPLPKYDEWQEKYYTICRDTASAVMVMTTTDVPEMCGVVTEALCMEGYNVVTPEYYGVVLSTRYFSEPKYGEILETIRDGLTILPTASFLEGMPSYDMFHLLVLNGKREVRSAYDNDKASGQNKLALFYTQMKNSGLY